VMAVSLLLLLLLPATNILVSLVEMPRLIVPSLRLETMLDAFTQSWYSDRIETLANFSIHIDWHPKSRLERFPSVEERIQLYMTNWYHPPCQDASIGRFADKYHKVYSQPSEDSNESWPLLNITKDPWDPASSKSMLIDSVIFHDVNIYLDRPILEDCARSPEEYNREGNLYTESRVRQRGNMQSYCSEVVELMNTLERLDGEAGGDSDAPTPLLAFFGDEEGLCEGESVEIPLIAKHRAGTTKEYVDQVAGEFQENDCWKTARTPLQTAYHQEEYNNRLSPILWKLELVRHWNTLPGALRKDTRWDLKKNAAFWGGDMTGEYEGETDLERCQSNQRCRFVLEHADSELIDARLCYHHGGLTNGTVNGVKIIREKVGVEVVQQYKVVISFEGNDVASGLKWMLQSESVVLMPPPTRTSWAMEELLQPWVHYIPMFPNGSNAEQMVQWALDHDRDAKRIAERATLFMYDLVYHPDADEDDRKIREEITRRYRALWH